MNTPLNWILSREAEDDFIQHEQRPSALFKVLQTSGLSISAQAQWLYQKISSTLPSYLLCGSCRKLRVHRAFSQEFKGVSSSHGIVLGTLQDAWRVDSKCILCHILFKTTHGTSVDPLISKTMRQVTPDNLEAQSSLQLRAFPLLPYLGEMQHQDGVRGLRNEVSEYFLAVVPDISTAVSTAVYEKALRDQVIERGYLICHQLSACPLFVPRVVSCLFEPDVVKDWLSCCQTHHMLCLLDRYPSTLHDISSTLNLIDCQSRRIVSCDTLEQPTELEYVALSYVWGTKNDAPTITSIQPELPDCLPRVIEDAILVTIALGYRFIWIDKYCIDQYDSLKKHEQIMNMDSVYQFAALTIIAGAGTDETYGLPGVSRSRQARQSSFKGNDISITSTLPSPQHAIRTSRWATRGWTYQEAVLSTRRLVFTDDQLYFECNSMSTYESLRVSWDAYYSRTRPYLKDFMRPTLFSLQGAATPSAFHIPSSQPRAEHFATYIHCAEQYSERTLRLDSDSLNAFSGIIRKLGTMDRSPVHHVWGVPFMSPIDEIVHDGDIIPTTSFDDSVLSRALMMGDSLSTQDCAYDSGTLILGLSWRHDQSSEPPRRRTDFPSWSWVGWKGAVIWPTIPQDLHTISAAWSRTSIHFENDSEDTNPIVVSEKSTPDQLQHPRILCVETQAMNCNAFNLIGKSKLLGLPSGGEATLYPSKPGLDAARVVDGMQKGWYEVIRLATVGATSYLMLIELDKGAAYRVGTLVVRGFYLTRLLFNANVTTYRIR
ncbi:heterokaryon incompatibility protein-domain-containing protein [Xylaria intraflava]|nr:heterokaryon incompatibility protein-domain-containing protein [Xylaria intraflava]